MVYVGGGGGGATPAMTDAGKRGVKMNIHVIIACSNN